MASSVTGYPSAMASHIHSDCRHLIPSKNSTPISPIFLRPFHGKPISVTSTALQNKCALRFPRKNFADVRCAVLVKESYGAKEVQGTARPSMEDASFCYLSPDPNGISFFSVYDGHGGKTVAQFLKEEFWSTYKKNLSKFDDYVKATNLTYKEVDEKTLATPTGFLGFMKERGLGGSKCGSTAATVALFNGEKVQIVAANVGDAKIVLSREKTAVQLSVDHKPDILAERMRIEAKNPFPKNPLVKNINGIWRVGGLLALSRAFGDAYLKDWSDGLKEGASGGFGLTAEPSVIIETLTPQDEWLILGSDGLWDFVSNQDAVDICNNSNDVTDANGLANKLVNTAISRGSTDDISVVVVKLSQDD